MVIKARETKARVRVASTTRAPAIRIIIIARANCAAAVGHLADAPEMIASVIIADPTNLLTLRIVPPDECTDVGAGALPVFQHLRPGPDELFGGHSGTGKPLRVHG